MFGSGEAGLFRQVAALYSDHYRQVPLYIKCLDQGRLAALDRWLHYTVTTIDRFHSTSNVEGGGEGGGGCLSVCVCVLACVRTSSPFSGAASFSVARDTSTSLWKSSARTVAREPCTQ